MNNIRKEDMRLYAVTDRTWLNGRTLSEAVEESLKGGVTFVQIREKDLSGEALEQEAMKLKKLAEKFCVPFVINDNVMLAKKLNTGVHIGQSDAKLQETRKLLGPDKIIGVSAHTIQEALEAEQSGADYLGVGAVFSTSTKTDANKVSYDTLKNICEAVSIPVVAIGGISRYNIKDLKGSKVEGIAVVSALYASGDIEGAAKELRLLSEEIV